MASVVNLFVDQGSDYTLTLTVKDDSGMQPILLVIQ